MLSTTSACVDCCRKVEFRVLHRFETVDILLEPQQLVFGNLAEKVQSLLRVKIILKIEQKGCVAQVLETEMKRKISLQSRTRVILSRC